MIKGTCAYLKVPAGNPLNRVRPSHGKICAPLEGRSAVKGFSFIIGFLTARSGFKWRGQLAGLLGRYVHKMGRVLGPLMAYATDLISDFCALHWQIGC